MRIELIEAPDYKFEMSESFGNPYGPNGRAAADEACIAGMCGRDDIAVRAGPSPRPADIGQAEVPKVISRSTFDLQA